ncbi:hypothetical protein L1049_028327 [Liquidambar formosana]|uniref:Uncharacterized protein n=1 Tax=Liquidambar formosana TaxID=63359 RepID=A0AAP0RKQ8_LIQFO
MALPIGGGGGGGRILCGTSTRTPYTHLPLRRHIFFPTSPSPPSLPFTTRTTHIVSAKKLSSRTGRFDSKNRRSTITTKEEEREQSTADIESSSITTESVGVIDSVDDGFVMPELPGEKPDFWEGPQWDAFGFFVQYMWAFGIIFALIACGIAVATYNEGATDFKETPAYKESIQSRELLEEPEASNSDVFESNPTEEAPSLE